MNYLTISDCIQMAIAITSLGGFLLLYSTFTLQANTFKEQQEVTRLTVGKYLYDIRPNFRIDRELSELSNDFIPQDHSFIDYKITVEKNVVHKVRFATENKSLKNTPLLMEKYDILQVGGKIQLIYGTFHYNDVHDINLYIYFEDEVGTQYYQLAHGVLGSLILDPPLKAKK